MGQTHPFAGGNGDADNPYQISTPEQLDAVRSYLDKHFVLVSNIDMKPWHDDNNVWVPIGKGSSPNTNTPFTGQFDGNCYGINRLQIFGTDVLGLFHTLSNATIKNLNLDVRNIDSGFVNEFRISVLVDILDKEILFKRPGYYYAQSGFRSRTPFERFFKKRTGMTVSDYIEFKKKGE